MNLLERIEINPRVLSGKPVIKGTRIPVELILKLLANGWTFEKIEEEYRINGDDIRACLLYASKILEDEEVIV